MSKKPGYEPTFKMVSGGLQILPPAPHLCQVCAVEHEPEMAHDVTSLYYQVSFHQQHRRYPSWRDAIAHLPAEDQAVWLEELAKEGLDPDAPGGRKKVDPKKEPL